MKRSGTGRAKRGRGAERGVSKREGERKGRDGEGGRAAMAMVVEVKEQLQSQTLIPWTSKNRS